MTDAGQHPAPATDSRPSRPILILLSDGFADWEIALLSAAAPDYYGADVRLCSLDGGDLKSMGGLRVTGLDELTRGRTTLVVTHDEQTARACDRIIWLEDGRVRWDGGPHDEMPSGHAFRPDDPGTALVPGDHRVVRDGAEDTVPIPVRA